VATAPFAEDRLTGGQVVRNLAAAGHRPEDVSHVVVSHASADHIGGLVDERGRRVFRRARTVFMRREWEFWSREEPTPRLNALTREWFLTCTRRIFPVVAPTVQLLDRDTELVPGVRVISAPGHTPGHLGLLVASGDERLLHLSDAVGHYVLSLEHPEWFFGADVDPELAVATRWRMLDRPPSPAPWRMAYHFPLPSLGRVAKTGEDSYAWSWSSPDTRTQRRPPADLDRIDGVDLGVPVCATASMTCRSV
jgi:glyoxylase-like metal-dependent hydrolase (beta-lactamase superfamily II)